MNTPWQCLLSDGHTVAVPNDEVAEVSCVILLMSLDSIVLSVAFPKCGTEVWDWTESILYSKSRFSFDWDKYSNLLFV